LAIIVYTNIAGEYNGNNYLKKNTTGMYEEVRVQRQRSAKKGVDDHRVY
jgi:hypothetical protein